MIGSKVPIQPVDNRRVEEKNRAALTAMRADLLAEDERLVRRRGEIREKVAALNVLLGSEAHSPTGLSQRILAALRATENRTPPGVNMTGLAKALGIKEGSPERKTLTAEVRAMMKSKMMYRTAGGRYRATQRG